MDYWAYENWRANGHVTKVHRGDCSHCNDGRGQKGELVLTTADG